MESGAVARDLIARANGWNVLTVIKLWGLGMVQSVVTRGIRLSLKLTISLLILSLAFGMLGMLGLLLIMGTLRSLG